MKLPRLTSDTLACVAGWLLLLCFAGISTTFGGFFVAFKPPFTRITPGEANLWLAMAFLLTPAGLLLGYGHRAALGRAVGRVHSHVPTLTRREKVLSLVSLGVIAAVAARISNELILGGYPLTDDEWAARFGGQALAQGKLLVQVPFALDGFPEQYMIVRGHALTSMDYLGTQLAWALDELSGGSHWVFAVSAALPIPCIAYVLARRLSPAWGAVGAVIAATSPMAFALSSTTHAHLNSRAFVALTLALHVWAAETWSPRRAGLSGLALGAGLICRPFETAAVLGPFALLEIVAAVKQGGARRKALFATMVGALVPLLAMLAHSYAVTGGPLPPRFSLGARPTPYESVSLWTRFGSNTAFNLMRLGVWFAGPLGMLFVALGVTRDRLTAVLSLGVLCVLLVGLGHQDYGIHAVGPIHQSECVVPLTLIAVHGIERVVLRVRNLGVSHHTLVGSVVAAMLVVHLGFSAVHGAGLHAQSQVQRDVYSMIDNGVPARARPAIVLAPPFPAIWAPIPEYGRRGTWVYEWRRPAPDFSDPILVLHDEPGVLDSVRQGLPGRTVFRMARDGELTDVTRLPEGAPIPAPMGSSSAPSGPSAPSPAAPSPELEALAVETFGDARLGLVACLREERAIRDDVVGKLPVEVSVDEHGLVASVRLGPSPVRGVEFDACAETALLTLVFPESLANRNLSITYNLQ